MSAVIGITFGNSSSSVAVAGTDGKVEVIANADGDRAIPSALSFVGSDEYHGVQAQSQLVRNPQNTIINFRDYIGKQFDEIKVSEDHVGAKPIKSATGGIAYKVTINGNETVLTIDEVASKFFHHLKSAAEDYIGKQVEGCVLTVPTDFNEHQRAILTKVCNEGGIKVLQIINEPSSALLAYLSSDEDKLLQDKIYAVIDIGGIRSDAAIISVRGGVLTILSTSHEYGLGGDQFDQALSEYFAKEFEKKNKSNPRTNQRSLAKLKAESIVVKKTLSNIQTSTCSIESLADGLDFHTSINRLRFVLIAKDIFANISQFVDKAVKKAGLDTLDIDEVLLVGGSSNIPKLASNIASIFQESTNVIAPSLDSKALDPAELVARGAALQASLIESFDDEEIAESLQPIVVNTQHLSKPIGIKNSHGEFVPILVAETAYPIKKSIEVTNGDSNSVLIELYEGKRTVKETKIEIDHDDDDSEDDSEDDEPEIVKEVVYVTGDLLAEISLKDLKPNSKLEVIVNITQNGTLHFSGRELKQGSVAVKGEITSA